MDRNLNANAVNAADIAQTEQGTQPPPDSRRPLDAIAPGGAPDSGGQTALLSVLSTISGQVIHADPGAFLAGIDSVVERTAVSVAADRVCAWVTAGEEGDRSVNRFFRWPQTDGTEPGRLRFDDLPGLRALAECGQVRSMRADASEDARLLAALCPGARTALLLPLHTIGGLRGFVSVERLHGDAPFEMQEVYALTTAVNLIVSAYTSAQSHNRFHESNRRLAQIRALLVSVNEVAGCILQGEDGDISSVVHRALGILGRSVGANRAAIWENYPDVDGALKSIRQAGWVSGKSMEESSEGFLVDMGTYIPQWAHADAQLTPLNCAVRDMNQAVQTWPVLRGCGSVLLLPIEQQGDFWGVMAFAHTDAKHRFNKEEMDILSSGAMMIISALARSEIRRHLAQAKIMASVDRATGLYNRETFFQHGRQLLEDCRAQEQCVSVLFLDLDHFKSVNDTYGHTFGDQVIAEFADILKRSVRYDDLCCRYGGEEFVVMLARSTQASATTVAERILESVRRARFTDHPDFGFTVSIGMSAHPPHPGETLQGYITNADQALYAAKLGGRDRLVDFSTL